MLPSVAFTWAMCCGSGTTSPPAPVTEWSATPSAESIDCSAETMLIRNATTTVTTRRPIATQTHIQRVRTLVSSVRLGSATFIVVAMIFSPSRLAGARVAGAEPLVDALGQVVSGLRLDEDVARVALDALHDAQRDVDALVDGRHVVVDPL